MAEGRDALRNTLDRLQLDPTDPAERPYLESVLRRLGYTEREIVEALGPATPAPLPVAAEPMEGARPLKGRKGKDKLAPEREFKLVVPAAGVAFAMGAEPAVGRLATDSPFDTIGNAVDFQDASEPSFETVETEFEAIPDPAYEPPAEEQPLEAMEPSQEPLDWQPEEEAQPEPEPEPLQEETSFDQDGFSPVQEEGIDNVGPAPEAPPRKRVRVRRVRAGSREEAERVIEGSGGRVIKSIPVDIVEHWGDTKPGQSTKEE